MFALKILNTFSELSFCSVVRSAFLINSQPFGPVLSNTLLSFFRFIYWKVGSHEVEPLTEDFLFVLVRPVQRS